MSPPSSSGSTSADTPDSPASSFGEGEGVPLVGYQLAASVLNPTSSLPPAICLSAAKEVFAAIGDSDAAGGVDVELQIAAVDTEDALAQNWEDSVDLLFAEV